MGKINTKNGDLYGEITMPKDLVDICVKSIDLCFPGPVSKWLATAMVAQELQKRADRLYQRIPLKDLQKLTEAAADLDGEEVPDVIRRGDQGSTQR